MDPVSITEAATKVYQVGGLVLVQTLVIVGFAWYYRRDSLRREDRMAAALESCQRDRSDANEKSTAALVTHATVIRENTEATRVLTDIMRDRPCLKDDTPIRGSKFPTPRPYTPKGTS